MDPQTITLPKIGDSRGNLTFLQQGDELPFEPKRAAWTVEAPTGAWFSSPASTEQGELFVAMSGSLTVGITRPDGAMERHDLNRPDQGLLLPPRTRYALEACSPDAIVLRVSDEGVGTQGPEHASHAGPTNSARFTTVDDVKRLAIGPLSPQEPGMAGFHGAGEVLPFVPRRVFYQYGIPDGTQRGAHAHKECHHLLVALSGSFDVVTNDGTTQRTHHLDRPDEGLYVPPGIWDSEVHFSKGALCFVLASEPYDEGDYLRQMEAFIAWKSTRHEG